MRQDGKPLFFIRKEGSIALFLIPKCICGKRLKLGKLKELFPELKDPIEKLYLRVYIENGKDFRVDLQLFQELGGQLTVSALEKLLGVNLEGLTKQFACRQFCDNRRNDADFQLGCGCKTHLPCLVSRIQQGSTQCSGSNSNHKHEGRKQLTQQDFEALWLTVKQSRIFEGRW